MEIYTKEDLKIFSEKFGNIINNVKLQQSKLFEPTKVEVDAVTLIIHNFIINQKRKICGTYAINFLLKDKNNAIFGDLDIPIISIYSPTPLLDLKYICDELHEKKFKHVLGRESQIEDMYTVSVNQQYYMNIFYAPENIYNIIPTLKIDTFTIVHPHYLLISYFLMLIQPLLNCSSLKQIMDHTYKLQKHYPFNNNNKITLDQPSNKNIDINLTDDILNTVHSFLKTKSSVIIIGSYAYSAIAKLYSMQNINIPDKIYHYETISDNYVNDTKELIDILHKTYKVNKSKIRIIEHYPFLNLYGYNVKIYYEDLLIYWGFDSNNKCIPYQNINSISVRNKTITSNKEIVKIGSFSLLVEMNLIIALHYKLNKNDNMEKLHKSLTLNLFSLRAKYFKENNLSIMDKTAFQEITLECLGKQINPQREYCKKIDKKIKENSGPYIFKYDPSDVKVDITSYKFANSSSNPINNSKNLRLI